MQFEPEVRLDDEVQAIVREDDRWLHNGMDYAVWDPDRYRDQGGSGWWEVGPPPWTPPPSSTTGIPGIYGAGDLVTHEGKLDLIATGFAEAAVAVKNVACLVNPEARVKPGHSTRLAVFKDK